MPESLRCCLILLAALFSGLTSGTEPISKCVCQGDYVQLFQNITPTNGKTVNLYINGLRKTLISTWHSIQNPVVLEGYEKKVSLDEYGTIWMRNIQLSEEGKYLLQYNTDITKSEAQINVMVAPTNFCKPTIKKEESFLIASLEVENCGRPEAQVQWLEYPGSTIISKYVLKLPPEKEAGTYYACAESPALKCMKTSKLSDLCTAFTVQGKVPIQGKEAEIGKDKEVPIQGKEAEIGKDKEVPIQGKEAEIGKDKDNNPPVSSEILDLKIATFVIVSFFSAILLLVATTSLIFLIRRRRSSRKKNVESRVQAEMKRLLNEQTVPHVATHLADDSAPFKLCEGTVSQLSRKKAENSTVVNLHDPEHTSEEATTEHQLSTDSVTTNEPQEALRATVCTICFASANNMIFVPCGHQVTCTKCSIPLQNCPVCKALIRSKIQAYYQICEMSEIC